jgi:hypothetical protein
VAHFLGRVPQLLAQPTSGESPLSRLSTKETPYQIG